MSKEERDAFRLQLFGLGEDRVKEKLLIWNLGRRDWATEWLDERAKDKSQQAATDSFRFRVYVALGLASLAIAVVSAIVALKQ